MIVYHFHLSHPLGLPPVIMIFNLCFLLKTSVDLSFLPLRAWPSLLLSLVFYLLTVHFNSLCTNPELTKTYGNNRKCQVCNHPQILRMKHCALCNQCIHKYDHHCKLMEVCIGEFNHKYYIVFLACYIVGQLSVSWEAATRIGDHIWLDEDGIERADGWYYLLALQLCLYGLVVPLFCCFLLYRHLRLVATNSTTWEEGRRKDITYLQRLP